MAAPKPSCSTAISKPATSYFGFAGAEHDRSHRYLAWAADRAGSEYYDIVIRDLETGKDSEEVIVETAGCYVWSNDSKAIYYTEYDDNHRPFRVRLHVIGTDQANDADHLFEEAIPASSSASAARFRTSSSSSTPMTTRPRNAG